MAALEHTMKRQISGAMGRLRTMTSDLQGRTMPASVEHTLGATLSREDLRHLVAAMVD